MSLFSQMTIGLSENHSGTTHVAAAKYKGRAIPPEGKY
jgi:hypothetical protein